MLVERGRAADRRRATALIDQALACAEDLGLVEARRKALALRQRMAERAAAPVRRRAH
jgi:hypothetical protein